VQHVESALAVDTYETHGRVALEAGDLAEFLQCASVLRGLHGACPGAGCPPEFAAYRLLHALCAGREAFAAELRDKHDVEHPYVAHAVAVAAAVRSGNAAAFFRLHRCAPRMAPYLMDRLAPALRAQALAAALAAYRPGVPVAWMSDLLAFDEEAQALQWALQAGAAHVTGEGGDDGMLCAPGRLATSSPRAASTPQPRAQATMQPHKSSIAPCMEVALPGSSRHKMKKKDHDPHSE